MGLRFPIFLGSFSCFGIKQIMPIFCLLGSSFIWRTLFRALVTRSFIFGQKHLKKAVVSPVSPGALLWLVCFINWAISVVVTILVNSAFSWGVTWGKGKSTKSSKLSFSGPCLYRFLKKIYKLLLQPVPGQL